LTAGGVVSVAEQAVQQRVELFLLKSSLLLKWVVSIQQPGMLHIPAAEGAVPVARPAAPLVVELQYSCTW
jgi:hypothetical protein